MRSALVRRLAALAYASAASAHAQIYAGTGEDGSLVLSNFPVDAAQTVVVAAPVAPAAPPAPHSAALAPLGRLSGAVRAEPPAPHSAALAPLIEEAARTASLPPQLLAAIVAVESNFDPRAVSQKGALGLMQLMPETAARFGVTDPFDPRQNLAGGAAYLAWLLRKFDGDLTLALAAYNAGEGAVIRAGYRIPPYEETRAYVPRVLRRLQRTGWH